MIIILKIIVSIFSTILFFGMLKSFITRKNQNLLFLPITFYYVFFIVPIILDIIVGPNQPYRYGFIISNNDFKTELIYCIGLIFNMYVYYKSFKKYNYKIDFVALYQHKDLFFFIVLFFSIGIIVYIFAKYGFNYFKTVFVYDIYELTSNIVFKQIRRILSVWCIAMCLPFLLEKRKKVFYFKLFLLSPFFIIFFLMNGKKAVIFLSIFLLLLIIYLNKIIKSNFKFMLLCVFMSISLLCYYRFYTANKITSSQRLTYYSYRTEFGRDDTQKMVIYDELYHYFNILDYRGQSLLFYPTFFVRRSKWPDKPYPYATYFTVKLTNRRNDNYIGWNMTTSIYDELISNTGLFALVYTPFLISYIVGLLMKKLKKDSVLDIIIELLGITIICLIFVVQINAHLYLNIILIALLIFRKIIRILTNKREVV